MPTLLCRSDRRQRRNAEDKHRMCATLAKTAALARHSAANSSELWYSSTAIARICAAAPMTFIGSVDALISRMLPIHIALTVYLYPRLAMTGGHKSRTDSRWNEACAYKR
ncbi:uncharacterized protein L969DRAFT_469198 [Mixia osmundae IAM 14324]|uniref:uncharacterized protein n=1 Tax=Mixia osmundae (strain CBS 9802 / IAM 14324 / JCM 22182 / KY 12970) TaxID=764103 RepID=UPI0004A54BDB|nr:uncharacterized protein L969DRAFT_469198 [Mixia osmundae IAM 14324]KEI38613.1 hypothetical protein L969DRAFT_469198 [Mixia osmundae IAM 14324]